MEGYDFNQIYQGDGDEKSERPTEAPEREEKGEKEEHRDVFEKISPPKKSNFGKD